MASRALHWLRNGVLVLFIVATLAGMFLPVYTDEVGWRFQERAGIDGVDKLFSELCGPNTLAVPPFFMWPVRWFSAVSNLAFASPLYVRLSGVLCSLAWVGLVIALIRRITRDSAERTILTIVGIGLMALGTIPLLLVWSRPEQPILLAATAAVFMAMADGGDFSVKSSAVQAWRRSVTILICAVIAVSYHLKGLFIVPVCLVCMIAASRGRSAHWPRLICAAAMIVMTAMATSYWKHRLQCPEDPILSAAYGRHSLGAVLSDVTGPGDIIALIGTLIGNAQPFNFVALSGPQETPLSWWLEVHQVTKGIEIAWMTGISVLWGATLIFVVLAFVLAGMTAWRERRVPPMALLSLSLFVSTAGWMSTLLIRNVYEAKFVLPMLALATVLGLSVGWRELRLRPLLKVLAAVLGVAAIASPIAIGMIYAPSLIRANRQQGYIAAQPVSTPVFGYSRVEPDIIAAGKLCGIDPVSSHALLVDDLTYFAYMRTKLPQHQLGVLGLWKGTITDPMAYLRSRHSDGAVLGCHLLKPDLRAKAKQAGRFCCLEAPR